MNIWITIECQLQNSFNDNANFLLHIKQKGSDGLQ